jgi:hypothetical protein
MERIRELSDADLGTVSGGLSDEDEVAIKRKQTLFEAVALKKKELLASGY